jgi:hypothetical protein
MRCAYYLLMPPRWYCAANLASQLKSRPEYLYAPRRVTEGMNFR